MAKVLITTVPFADKNNLPLDLLRAASISYLINPIGRKLKEDELAEMVSDAEVLIAGTEPITAKVMDRAGRLKLISRVGIGLDSVDLLAAEKRGIQVSYTPDAPAPAVAEFTIGLMLSLLRSIHTANQGMHAREWNRYFGRRLAECTIGIVGVGRIGSKVLQHLAGFQPRRVMLNDLAPKPLPVSNLNVEWESKDSIYEQADIISLHLPLTPQTKGLIQAGQLLRMKKDAVIINTARGGIINEADLAQALRSGHLAGAAIDVFEQEPYRGELAAIDRCLLTSHMGSMSIDCRAQMEIEATREAIRYFKGEPLTGLVPAEEYEIQRLST